MTAGERRHRRDSLLASGFTFAVVAVVLFLLQQPASGTVDPVAHGHDLFITGCSSCHGVDGGGAVATDGSVRGPSLVDVGAASAYYELSTGRMPLAGNDSQPKRKRPVYSGADLDALVAYVGSLGNGPPLPTVDVTNADLADGGEQFRASCAACHSASGAGGALSYGQAAPSLSLAEPLQVGAAVRSGPGQMPVFGADVLSPSQVNDIARYVQFLRAPDDRGGIAIGRTGPVPEGFVAWFFGIGALVLLVAWIGTRAPPRSEEQHG